MLSNYPPEAHIEWFATNNPLAELYCFLLGCTLYVAIKNNKQNILALIICFVLAVTSFGWYQFEFLFVLIILLAVNFSSVTKNKYVCKCISFFSKGSFAVYLIHPMVLKVAPTLWRLTVNDFDNVCLYCIYLYFICILASYGLYYLIIVKIENFFSKKFLLNCKSPCLEDTTKNETE